MQSNKLTSNQTVDWTFDPNKISFPEVFAARNYTYLNYFGLFLSQFNSIPNCIQVNGIDCKKANIWFAEKYKLGIKECYYSEIRMDQNKKHGFEDAFYFLYEDLIVNFDTLRSVSRFLFRKTELSTVEQIIAQLTKFKKRKQKPEISLLVNGNNGIEIKSLEISKPKLSIEDNYNDDFKGLHKTILRRLSRKNEKGLVLLHGKPGTGKTSYIRYLIASIKKDVIFLPPNMASAITNPNLISILIENPNSILVIEDAENIVVDRNKDGSSPVSALLNISDGLLADCLNVQIICSFNTDISRIDSAFMRKGRLIAKYEFKELEVEKAKQLSKKLGFDTQIDVPMTLTSIYNQDENDFQQSRRTNPIGFRAICENSLGEN